MLQQYAQEAIDGDGGGVPVMVVAPAASASGHGIARIPALSIAVMFFLSLQMARDYTEVFSTLQTARQSPGFPGVASLFQLTLMDSSMKFKRINEVIFDAIGAADMSSIRPMFVNCSRYEEYTILWYYMRDQNQAENTFLGTDALSGTYPLGEYRSSDRSSWRNAWTANCCDAGIHFWPVNRHWWSRRS